VTAAPADPDLPLHLTAETSPGCWVRQPGDYTTIQGAVDAAAEVAARGLRVRVCDKNGRTWRGLTPPAGDGPPFIGFSAPSTVVSGGYDPDPDLAVLAALVLAVSPEHLTPGVLAAAARLTAGLGLEQGATPAQVTDAIRVARAAAAPPLRLGHRRSGPTAGLPGGIRVEEP
jgi:hypothetical protein